MNNETTGQFPEYIQIDIYRDGTYVTYTRDYIHEKGGCYYHQVDEYKDPIFGSFVCLYPDGHLTYLWNGIEQNLNCNWKYIE